MMHVELTAELVLFISCQHILGKNRFSELPRKCIFHLVFYLLQLGPRQNGRLSLIITVKDILGTADSLVIYLVKLVILELLPDFNLMYPLEFVAYKTCFINFVNGVHGIKVSKLNRGTHKLDTVLIIDSF